MRKNLTPEVFEEIKLKSKHLVSLIDSDLIEIYLKKINSIDQLYNRRSRECKKCEGTLHENNKILLIIRDKIFALDTEIDLIKSQLKQNMIDVGDYYKKEFLSKENYSISKFKCPKQLSELHTLRNLFGKICRFDFGNNSAEAIDSLKKFKAAVEMIKAELA